MKATGFECAHQRWIHLALVGVAFCMYFFDPVDVVWALVRHKPDARTLERMLFAVATGLTGCGAAMRTAANRAQMSSLSARVERHLGSVFYAVGIGALAPLWGFLILVAGEAALALRLFQRESAPDVGPWSSEAAGSWASAMRPEAAKWGLFFTMIVFTAVLVDRVADILAVASLLIAAALNWRLYCHRTA